MEAREDLRFSVSATTRKPRPGEVDGVHYFFVTKERFEENIVKYIDACGHKDAIRKLGTDNSFYELKDPNAENITDKIKKEMNFIVLYGRLLTACVEA